MPNGDTPSPVRPLPSWVPAGWYPDPLGQGAARYWDGKRWTLEYRDSPPPQPIPASQSEVPASQSPSAAVAAGAAPNGQPSARERWREIPKGARIAIVAGAILVLLIIIGAAAGSGSKTTTTSAGPGGPGTGPSTSTSTPPPPSPPVALKLDTGDYSVTSARTTLHGTVTKGATVTVEGHYASVHGTHWNKTVALHIGPNSFGVEATLAGHEPGSESITVTRHHTTIELEAIKQAAIERQRKREQEEEERVARYKASAITIPYNQLNKNPEEFEGKVVKYRGQIFQIQEEGGEGGFMLLAVDEEYEIWSDNIWVNFHKHIRAAEKDIVTVYGKITGQKEYDTQIGGKTYVPEMDAKYIEE